jgi:hypothetical protein
MIRRKRKRKRKSARIQPADRVTMIEEERRARQSDDEQQARDPDPHEGAAIRLEVPLRAAARTTVRLCEGCSRSAQSRCTQACAEAQSALSFHPPSTPSSFSFLRLYECSHSPLPLPARSRVSVLPASKLSKIICFCICLVQRPIYCRCHWPQRHLRVQSQIWLIDFPFAICGC